jgi:hypothetical protein
MASILIVSNRIRKDKERGRGIRHGGGGGKGMRPQPEFVNFLRIPSLAESGPRNRILGSFNKRLQLRALLAVYREPIQARDTMCDHSISPEDHTSVGFT